MLSPEFNSGGPSPRENLRRHPLVQAYHEAVAQCEADREAVDLEAACMRSIPTWCAARKRVRCSRAPGCSFQRPQTAGFSAA